MQQYIIFLFVYQKKKKKIIFLFLKLEHLFWIQTLQIRIELQF